MDYFDFDKLKNVNMIYENYYFKLYLSGEKLTNIHIDSTPKEVQEIYDSNDVLSLEDKLKLSYELLQYIFNLFQVIDKNNYGEEYTLFLNVNLVMIEMPMEFFISIKNLLDSIRDILKKKLIETYFKIDNKFAQKMFDLVLSLYTPVKPIHVLKN